MMQRRMRTLCAAIALSLTAFTTSADTLRDIYDLALKNDVQLKVAEATYKADKETEFQTRSRLLPQINGDASKNVDTTARGWSVTLSQQIFDLPAWFSFKNGKQISLQAQAQFAAEQQELVVRCADAYFAVLRATDNLQVALAEEEANKRQLDRAQHRFKVGLVAITDVHEARAAYDASVAARLGDEGNLAIAYEILTTLTGQPHANLWLLDKELPVVDPEPTDRAAWVQFALANNYALKAAQYGMEAAQENATAKRYEHAPKLSGDLVYKGNHLDQNRIGNSQTQPATGSDPDNTTRAAVLKLTVPIFSGGYTSSTQRQAYEQSNAALERKIGVERGIMQATRAQHIATTTDVQRVKARAQSITSAQSAFNATRAGYEVGTRNIVDVLQFQRTFFSAQRDYANARYDYVLDMLRLKQQAGLLGPEDIYDLNDWLVAPDSPKASTYKSSGGNR